MAMDSSEALAKVKSILTSLMRIFYVKDRSSVGRESLTVVKQVFPAWDIVGWYAVKEMPRNAIDIQQQLAAFQSDPVAILLHASADALSRAQKTGALPIECYVTRDTQLYSVPTSLSTSSAEHVVLKDANEYMQKTHAFQGDNSATLAAFMAERDAVQTLHERICEIKCYVDQVKAGTRPHNDEILRRIAAAVANQGYQKAPEYKVRIVHKASSHNIGYHL
ncbi:hypothetical protein MYAM1_000325 [Malassezia yamatoensis]|uniref:EIF3F/CSN6-like C-terminal domain-containing protein n=1 Tax=Malassezia yamatoensis TaxID=253288 RepID=A0AAJ5YNL3_9BASI|nr:hypothetical protein MYAM1_000325 [Malassezia yamatoensis]